MSATKFSIPDRVKSFQYAFAGLRQFFQSQHNAIIHALATVLAVIMSILLKLSSAEWIFIIMAIAMVWTAELFNTAIEALCDMIMLEKHPKIKFIKDVAAAAVLVSALSALLTGLIIFLPKLIKYI
jgi:diacylglycerol kinase (ATP)